MSWTIRHLNNNRAWIDGNYTHFGTTVDENFDASDGEGKADAWIELSRDV
jgi:hypothetical protein